MWISLVLQEALQYFLLSDNLSIWNSVLQNKHNLFIIGFSLLSDFTLSQVIILDLLLDAFIILILLLKLAAHDWLQKTLECLSTYGIVILQLLHNLGFKLYSSIFLATSFFLWKETLQLRQQKKFVLPAFIWLLYSPLYFSNYLLQFTQFNLMLFIHQ